MVVLMIGGIMAGWARGLDEFDGLAGDQVRKENVASNSISAYVHKSNCRNTAQQYETPTMFAINLAAKAQRTY